jgi:glycosyltransferase involved in cell wall biosynthesis
MTTPPTLSVVLPNYNHAVYVGRALAALIAQERAPDEIIVIDDGSTDDSVRVIEQFAAQAPSIHVLLNPQNRGVIPTLDRGLREARGKYIYFAAADDYVLPGFFKAALPRLEANPDLGLFCGEAMLVDGRTDRPFAVRPAVRPRMRAGVVTAADVLQLLRSSDNWILTGSAVFRRECAVWGGGFDEHLGSFADGFLARKIALKFGFFFEPKIVATWFVLPDSVSRKTALEQHRASRMLEVATAQIAGDPVFPAWYANAFGDRWRFATCRLALQAVPTDREFLLAMGAGSSAERAELDKLLSLPGRKIVHLAILARLWYRLRPTSLTALLRTMLAMRAMRLALAFRFGQFRSMTPANAASAGVHPASVGPSP